MDACKICQSVMHEHESFLCPYDRGLVDHTLSDKIDRLCDLAVSSGVAAAASSAAAEAAEAAASEAAAAYFIFPPQQDETLSWTEHGAIDLVCTAAAPLLSATRDAVLLPSRQQQKVPEAIASTAHVIISTVVSTSTASVSATTLTYSSTALAADTLSTAAEPASKVTPDAESSSSTAAALTAATSTRGFDDQEHNAASLYELDVPDTTTAVRSP